MFIIIIIIMINNNAFILAIEQSTCGDAPLWQTNIGSNPICWKLFSNYSHNLQLVYWCMWIHLWIAQSNKSDYLLSYSYIQGCSPQGGLAIDKDCFSKQSSYKYVNNMLHYSDLFARGIGKLRNFGAQLAQCQHSARWNEYLSSNIDIAPNE